MGLSLKSIGGFLGKAVAANTVTIDPADTIDGAASFAFTTQWEAHSVVSDGTNWYLLI